MKSEKKCLDVYCPNATKCTRYMTFTRKYKELVPPRKENDDKCKFFIPINNYVSPTYD